MHNLTEYFDKVLERIYDFEILNHESLIEGINELRNLVGLDEIKLNILDMLVHILISKKYNHMDAKNSIYNVLITGEPGVAKTTLAKIIGKILASASFFNDSFESDPMLRKMEYINRRTKISQDNFAEIYKLFDKFSFTAEERNDYNVLKNYIDGNFEDILKYSEVKKVRKYNFVEVSRDNLIGKFQGHTADNVRKYFESAVGGVLFFDEAYSIINSPHGEDDFGRECLNMINKLMLEMAGKMIVIFAGYENDIKNCLFNNQKGLESRFLWHFNIKNYKMEEIAEIFVNQAKRNNWKFDQELTYEHILKTFEQNSNYFISSGRDTQKLLMHITKNYTINKFFDDKIENMVLTKKMFDDSIVKLKENSSNKIENYNIYI